MAKTVEKRIKELVDSTTRTFLVKNWAEASSPYSKDLNAPIFKKLGDIATLAKRYDAAAETFIKFDKKKNDAIKLFDAPSSNLEKIIKQVVGLKKELEEILKDEGASTSLVKDPKKVEDHLNNWEEGLKVMQSVNKERKAIFDRIMKLGEEYAKTQTDAIGNVKKEVAVAMAGLAGSNNELNALEAQMRSAVVNYQKTAIDMDKKEIADAVRGFVNSFGL
jgi:chromosome segregation ATPase